MLKQVLLGVVGLAVSAGVATAGPFTPQTVTVNAPGTLNSVGPAGFASNGSFTHTFNGPAFRVGSVRISGTLVNGTVPGSWANDASFRITSGQGGARNFQGISQVEGYTGPISVGPTQYSFVDPLHGYTSGTWTFQSYEVSTGDESIGTNTPENIWTSASFEFIEMTPAAAPSVNQAIGALPNGGTAQRAFNQTNPKAVQWMSFDFAGGAGSRLEIDTLGTSIPTGFNPLADNDTVLALYDSYGVLVYSSDNINVGTGEYESRIITGDGVLPAGTYYLAAANFGAGTGVDNFNVTNNAPYTGQQGIGSLQVNIKAVPAPASLALLGLGGIAAGKRRRK